MRSDKHRHMLKPPFSIQRLLARIFLGCMLAGCENHTTQSQPTTTYTATGNRLIDTLAPVSASADTIRLDYVSRTSHPMTNTPDDVDTRSSLQVLYFCTHGCDLETYYMLKTILKSAQEIPCEIEYYIGKLSFVSEGKPIWSIYLDANDQSLNYQDTCYKTDIDLYPVIRDGGIFQWNKDLEQ